MVVFADIPNGINAPAGIGGNNLSLGMQKCVVILRGIFRKGSKVVIFDEPIAGLDPETAKKIMRLIHDYTQNQTVIMITHNQAIKQYVNYSVSLSDIQSDK
jgi:ABC-type transport system involved in cytochrome bd biosynthesis fused ATPase/permease subunit